ncbi:MAG: zinc metallopeptidase [Bacteroidales bacterium]|nr:zinc metallopeptidase [Bacteroidales bacterium]
MIYIIMIAVMVASAIIQAVLNRRFEKYSRVRIGLTGAEVAERMLHAHGIHDVTVASIPGKLTDHYDPTTKTLNLSEAVYSMPSVAAAAVAAHECGHAVQHATGYAPLRLRSALVPFVNFASKWVSWALLLGIIFIQITSAPLWIAIILFGASTLFSLVTLPVEINASRRAVAWLSDAGITTYETKPMAQDALKWAAYTYVIAALGSLATLLYYIGIARD